MRPWRTASVWLFAYLAAGWLALQLQPVGAPALWYPPVAVGTGWLLRMGRRWWPLVLLADLAVSLGQYGPHPVALVVAANTTLEALAAASLLRWAGFFPNAPRSAGLPLRLLVAGVLATLLGATLGTLVVARLGTVPGGEPLRFGARWWAGDATSLLTLLPAIVLWRPRDAASADVAGHERPLERGLLFAFAALVVGLMFRTRGGLGASIPGLLVMLGGVPALWAALRFDARQATVVVAWTSLLTALSLRWPPASAPVTATIALDAQLYLVLISLGSLAFALAIQGEHAARRRAESAVEQLRWRDQHLRLAMRAGRIGSWDLDIATGKLRWSESLFEFLGYAPDSVEPTTELWFSHLISSEERDYARTRSMLQMTRPGQFSNDEQIRTVDGRVRDVIVRGEVFESPGLRRAVGVVEDVTDRIHESHAIAQLAAIVESSEDAIIAISRDGLILSWNRAAERMFGHSAPAMIGQSKLVLVPPEERDAMRRALESVANGEHMAPRETSRLHADGHAVMVLESFSPVHDKRGAIVAVASILRDIGPLRGLEAQLRQSQKMEAVGRLAGGIAHDFNNMLTAILGFSDLLESSLPPGSAAHADVAQIRHAGERAAALTRQLLAFSRHQPQRPVPTRLDELVIGLEPMLRRLLGDDVELVLDLEHDIAPILVDPSQIEQVVMNLGVNARDAMPTGGRLHVELRSVVLEAGALPPGQGLEPGRFALLSVSDTGVGMDADTLAHLFEPFFTTKEPGKGTGLGLSTAYGIVRQYKGGIWVFSEIGHGTSFRVALPFAGTAGLPVEHGAEAEPPAGRGETVLLLEDEPQVLEFVRVCLEGAGYRVLPTRHPQEASALLQHAQSRIDLLLTDVVMPRLNGAEVARIAKHARPELAILFMSGFHQAAFAHDTELLERSELLAKPFSRRALLEAVHRALAPSLHTRG